MKAVPACLTMINLKCRRCGATNQEPLTEYFGPMGLCNKCNKLENYMEPVSVEEMSLGQAYVLYVDMPENREKTFDDFYDFIGLSQEVRSDFATSCMLKQAQKIINNETSS